MPWGIGWSLPLWSASPSGQVDARPSRQRSVFRTCPAALVATRLRVPGRNHLLLTPGMRLVQRLGQREQVRRAGRVRVLPGLALPAGVLDRHVVHRTFGRLVEPDRSRRKLDFQGELWHATAHGPCRCRARCMLAVCVSPCRRVDATRVRRLAGLERAKLARLGGRPTLPRALRLRCGGKARRRTLPESDQRTVTAAP